MTTKTTSEPRANERENNSSSSSITTSENLGSSSPRGETYDVNILRVYLSQTLSAWGNRMWSFAVGLYLVILFPESLQYTAIYGFTTCICGIVGGPFIGKWVDKSLRLRAATYSIAVQNLAVSLSAVLLILMIQFHDEMVALWDGIFQIVFLCGIIFFAVIAELAAVGSKIAIEKDWIVVLAQNDENKLSRMNATMRTIDLTTFTLAPAVVAQIIFFISRIAGAAFIAGWNLISGVIEIYLLRQIFMSFPELAKAKIHKENKPSAGPGHYYGTFTVAGADEGEAIHGQSIVALGAEQENAKNLLDLQINSSVRLFTKGKKQNCCSQYLDKILESLIGWKDYFQSPLLFGGLGLACLYMTVLGFDSITIGYMYSQGVSESLVGILTAVGAIPGILGSVSFPFLRRKLGKCAVGIFGFGFQTVSLVLCVVSVFLPGSPFVPEALWTSLSSNKSTTENPSGSGSGSSATIRNVSYTSVVMFSTGILISRYGLWIADLSVTQFFQEEVPETQRGILNGVQDSLNQAMNLIVFILVIVFPTPPTFGYLIMLSWLFILLGWVNFMIFTCSWRRRQNKIKTIKMYAETTGIQLPS